MLLKIILKLFQMVPFRKISFYDWWTFKILKILEIFVLLLVAAIFWNGITSSGSAASSEQEVKHKTNIRHNIKEIIFFTIKPPILWFV